MHVFFSVWVFFHDHSRITGLQGKGEVISLTPLCDFHPLHRHLDISRAITTESSRLHIGSSRTRFISTVGLFLEFVAGLQLPFSWHFLIFLKTPSACCCWKKYFEIIFILIFKHTVPSNLSIFSGEYKARSLFTE